MTDSYIQISIGGQLRGWKMNQMTLEIWSKSLDSEAFSSSSNYAAVYGGLFANCRVKKEEAYFTYEQVCDWVDELTFTEEGKATLVAVQNIFEASQYYLNLVERLNLQLTTIKEVTEKPKKKVIKKSTKKK